MKADVVLLTVLVMSVRLSCCCYEEKDVLFCFDVPSDFRPGYTTLVLFLKEVGQINSTVLLSSKLTSVTRLRIDNAGVTGVADGAFSSFQNLVSLSLEQNLLTQLSPKWLGQPELLLELNLSGNQIQVLSESMFSGLTNLLKLVLSNNWISVVDQNTFSSLASLTDLDLSGNRLNRLSPRVLRSLWSSRLRLDQNPWACSCDAQVFIELLRELQNRSLLLLDEDVTCQTPPSLTGQAVWRVTECVAPLPSLPPTSDPAAWALPTSPVSAPTSQSPLESNTSLGPKPIDIRTTPVTEKPVTSQQTSSLTSRLVAVIVVLSVLLSVVCVAAGLGCRKHSSNAVEPRCEEEQKEQQEVKTHRSLESFGPSVVMKRDMQESEVRVREIVGVRSQSADAVLVASSFFLSGSDDVATKVGVPSATDFVRAATLGEDSRGEVGDGCCGSVHRDSYLSIGAEQNQPNGEEPCTREGQRSQMRRTVARIPTWPPTAAQWRERCRGTQQGEECDEEDPPNLEVFRSVEVESETDENKFHIEEETSGVTVCESGHLEAEEDAVASIHSSDSDPEHETRNQTEQRGDFEEVHNFPEQSQDSASAESSQKREGSRSGVETRPPSSGVSPDDLQVVDSPVMDLLREVVQNHGRWTRERWRESRRNK